MTSIVFDLPFSFHNQFIDLSLVRLHLRNPFNPHTWFRPRRHWGSPRGCSPQRIRSASRCGMMTLVQIREREERRQQHDLEALPVFYVKSSERVERLRCGAMTGVGVPVQIVVEDLHRAIPDARGRFRGYRHQYRWIWLSYHVALVLLPFKFMAGWC